MATSSTSLRTRKPRAAVVIVILALAAMFLGQTAAVGSPPPPDTNSGCVASVTQHAKVSGKIVGKFTIKCVKAQIIMNINGVIKQVGGKQAQDLQGKECHNAFTCTQTLTWGTDPSGTQTYQFFFDPSATWAGVSSPSVTIPAFDAVYECQDMGCMPKLYMLTLKA